MAQPQPTLTPCSGIGKEKFREFEHLLQSIMAVAASPPNQQASFLHLNLRDAALRYFKTSSLAMRNDLALSLETHENHSCNPQLQELWVLNLENLKLDPKTDEPENSLVTLQTNAFKTHPEPNPPAAALINGAAAYAAAEHTRFDQDTARLPEINRLTKRALSKQVRRQFFKIIAGN